MLYMVCGVLPGTNPTAIAGIQTLPRPGVTEDAPVLVHDAEGVPMNFTVVIRYTILALSSALMVLGVLVMAGLMIPRAFQEQYRVILGAVIFLYGAYRFSVAYFRRPKE
jgi:hypothetical protein